MRLAQRLGLVVISAAALLPIAGMGIASATTLTGPENTALGVGTLVNEEAEGTAIYHTVAGDLECQQSSLSGKVSKAGGPTETVEVTLEGITFRECRGIFTFRPLGTQEIHTSGSTANDNGLLTSTGTELTTEALGLHCIYKTSNTPIGTITGSAVTGGNATLDVAASIPRTGGRSGSFCGASAQWTGSYKFTSPSTLNVD